MSPNYLFISGLQRSGSTLLQAILSQNPRITTRQASPLPFFLTSVSHAYESSAKELIELADEQQSRKYVLRAIMDSYYRDASEIVIDKSEKWAVPFVHDILCSVIPNAKTLVLFRPLLNVIQSFVALCHANGLTFDIKAALTQHTPLSDGINGLAYALRSGSPQFLFGNYDDLVQDPQHFLETLYDFYGLDSFEHRFNDIEAPKDNGAAIGLRGLHEVRPKISKQVRAPLISEPDRRLIMEFDEALSHDYQMARSQGLSQFI